MTVFGRWPVRRVSSFREWSEKALRVVEEFDQHFAAGEGGEEVVFVAVDNSCSLVPKVVTVEEDVVCCVEFAAVGTGGVVLGSRSKAVGVVALKSVACDELKGGGLVVTGGGGEYSADEIGGREAGWFPEGCK